MKAGPERQHLFDRPRNVRRLLRSFYAICILLAAADFLLRHHGEHPLEAIPLFYPVFGFLACVTLVLAARQLRRLVGRPEHYYDDNADSDRRQPDDRR